MRDTFLVLAVLFLFVSCYSPTLDADVYITKVQVVDPDKGLIGTRFVALKGEKIIKVAIEEMQVSDETLIIDGSDKFLIPGLWDAHVHFDYIPELAPSMFDLFLLHGVTSVRDTGGRLPEVLKWKNRAQSDPSKAPRVMVAGPLVDGNPSVYNGSSPSRPPLGVETSTVEEARIKTDKSTRVSGCRC